MAKLTNISKLKIRTKYLKLKIFTTGLIQFAKDYWISVDGDVWTERISKKWNPKGELMILKPKKQKDRNYLYTGVYGIPKGKKDWYRIHRLVWEHFVGPIPDGYVIHHRDNDGTNNVLWNLNCITQQQNTIEYQKWKKNNL